MKSESMMTLSIGEGLDARAVCGAVRVEAEADEFWGGSASRPYRSRVMHTPTWRQLMKCAEQQSKKTLNQNHVFVEGFEFVRKDGEIAIIRLVLGS